MSYSGNLYDIEIHDTDFTGTSTAFKSEHISIRYYGATQSRLNEIITASLNLGILIEGANQEQFITDLIGANESRFKVLFKRLINIKFVGYLITDLIQMENMSYPFTFEITAVDGIARLKDLEYNNDGNPYTGKQTIEEHLSNIISKIGLSSLAGSTLIKKTEWLEDTHQQGADLLQNTRFDHDIFTTKDTNGNNKFTNPFSVLKEICKTFLARFVYWDGSYHFQQINNYETLNLYDVSNDKAISGGIWSFLPALQKAKVILKYGETLNVAKGLNLTQDNTSQTITGTFKANQQFEIKGTLSYRTIFSAAYLAANGIKDHRVKFGLMIRLSSTTLYYYLKRSAGTSDFYTVTETPINWFEDSFTNKHYYEIQGEIVFENNYNFNKVININIVTPNFPGIDNVNANIELVSFDIIRPDGGVLSSPDIELTWTLFGAHIQEKGATDSVVNHEKVFTAENNIVGNSKTTTIETKLGDVDITTSPSKLEIFNGSTWEDSTAWTKGSFSAIPIGQLLANEILSGQSNHIRQLLHTLILPNFSPLQRLTYKGVQYLFLRGEWNPETDLVNGEWVQINADPNSVTALPVITGDGSTNTNPTSPNSAVDNLKNGGVRDIINNGNSDVISKNIPITILDAIKNGKISADITKGNPISQIDIGPLPQGTKLAQGDVVRLVHPVTGQVKNLTLAANPNNSADTSKYVGGNTTLFFEEFTPTVNYPIGSFLVKDNDSSPIRSTIQSHKVINHSGATVEVPFDLPTDEAEVDKRLTVQRGEFGIGIYIATYTIENNGGGDRRVIRPTIAYKSESILIKLSE